MMMASKQDQPDDNVALAEEGLELLRAFRRIESATLRRKVIKLAKSLAPKEK
jgi:hypothetical protein